MELPKLRDFLDAFAVPWHIALGVSLACGLLLYLHQLGNPYLQSLPAWVLTIAFVLFLCATVVVAVHILRAAGSYLSFILERRKRRLEIRNALTTLSDKEREVLSFLFTRNQQSLVTQMGGPDVSTLVQKRLLVPSGGVHSMLEWPHMVPNDVWIELKVRAGEFQTADPTAPAPYRRRRF